MAENHEIVLRGAASAPPIAADFALVERDIPRPADGQLLVRVLVQSLDPYLGQTLRGRHMGHPAPEPGATLPGFTVGEVLESRFPGIAKGDHVVGECGWTEFGLMDGAAVRRVGADLPSSAHLGVLGTPGLTAWAAVTQLAKVGPGDVFTVDAAAGAVGGVAGQIAKLLGARTVGVAGGAEKCALVTDSYGFDACIDYRQDGWVDRFVAATDGGPSAHLENVGLSVLMPVMRSLKLYGRVVLCGLAEHYHKDAVAQMPVGIIIGKRAAMLGLVVYDFYPRWAEWEAMARPWIAEGKLALALDMSEGLASAPAQFERLMRGENLGKCLVRVSPDAL